VKPYDEKNTKTDLSIRAFINLDPQLLNRFSAAFSPLLHRFIAGYPHANPQIFRAFSASFAHWIVREFFRSVCAGIAQELADRAGKKNGEKEANFASCGKSSAIRGSWFAIRVFHRGTWNTPTSGRNFDREDFPREPRCKEADHEEKSKNRVKLELITSTLTLLLSGRQGYRRLGTDLRSGARVIEGEPQGDRRSIRLPGVIDADILQSEVRDHRGKDSAPHAIR